MTATTAYQIKMENFEGPLDLLCHLVEKNKMDICDIKINDITNQYLDYLQIMQEMNLEVTSEFIIMASKLIYLKSKTLLPVEGEDEEEEIDLVQMLLEYKKYKETTVGMKERLEEYGRKFYKQPEKEANNYRIVIKDMYATIINREKETKNKNADNLEKIAVSEKVTIRSKIKEILKQLWNKPTFVFNKIFNSNKQTKTEIVTAFLGLLELSRMNKVRISQNVLFGDIQVTKIKRQREETKPQA